MALASNIFQDYELPTRQQLDREAPQYNLDSLSMFWQCTKCKACVICFLDECPKCEGEANERSGQ